MVKAFIHSSDDAAIEKIRQLGVVVSRRFGGVVTAAIPVDALEAVSLTEGIDYVETGSEVRLLMDSARVNCSIDTIHNNSFSELPAPFTGKGIIVGMIDLGFEYGHPAFLASDGETSRIKAVWNQSGKGGNVPEEFGYGTEYLTPEDIAAAKYDSRSSYHGTHTTGIAAGGKTGSSYYGVAPDADIVLVSLKGTNVDIANGIAYIFDYADKAGKPCVINMSLGSHSGPHDGTSTLDQVIDAATGPGRIIVGSCGNEGEFKIHTSKKLTADDKVLRSALTVPSQSVYPYDHVLEIWGSRGSHMRVKMMLVDKEGNILNESDVFDTDNPNQKTVVKTLNFRNDGASATIYISAVEQPETGVPSATMEIRFDGINYGRYMAVSVEGDEGDEIHMWNLAGNEFSSVGIEGWSDGDNACTVGEIGGTAEEIISVGSYDNRNRIYWWNDNSSSSFPYVDGHKRSFFSSVGPTVDGRIVPHIMAPGNPVVAPINKFGYSQEVEVYASDCITDDKGNKYYYSYDQGTSMSSPVVTGSVALFLEALPELTPSDIKAALAAGADTDDEMGSLPNNFYGNGRLNAYETLKHLLKNAGIDGAPAIEAGFRAWTDGSTVNIIADENQHTVNVYDLAGRRVASARLTPGTVSSIDASSWGKGVFILKAAGTAPALKIAL